VTRLICACKRLSAKAERMSARVDAAGDTFIDATQRPIASYDLRMYLSGLHSYGKQ
jgi:hypothetical protein